MVVSGYSLGEVATGTSHEQQQRILRGDGSRSEREEWSDKKVGRHDYVSLVSRRARGGLGAGGAWDSARVKLIRRARALILDAEKNKTRKRREHGEDADDSFDAHRRPLSA